MKVSEYVAEYLVNHGIMQCFSVTGGFAMHLNDAFGKTMNVVYTHGESPAGYAALGYSSVRYQPSMCCVTSGCGATNAVTPCTIAYQDSVPVLFMSGQVHRDVNIRKFASNHRHVRGYFGSDADIVSMVGKVTKMAHELWDPSEVKKVLDECFYHLTNGRLGPVWISIPVDVQSMQVPDALESWTPPLPMEVYVPPAFLETWKGAKRPLVLAGNGIHISRTEKQFRTFLEDHRVPYVVSFFGLDLGSDEIGRVGLIGNRSGNFAIQNCDVLLCLGCRLSKSITGYNRDMFAPNCSILYVDVDGTEFLEEKRTSLDIHADLATFFSLEIPRPECVDPEWLSRTQTWKKTWDRELPSLSPDNPYPITKHFFDTKPPGCISVASSGSLYCVVWHMFKCLEGDRFISSGHGDMGYEVPAAIGASLHGKQTFAFVGDGSFQLNLQELQTIKTYNLPVIVMYYNNGGYGAIQITQNAVFGREFGTTPGSGLECPDIAKIAEAYGIPCYDSRSVDYGSIKGPAIVEVVCSVQERFPKISNKLGPDGKFVNLPYQDMAPFLDRTVLEENMFK